MRILAVDPGGTTGWALLDSVTSKYSSGVLVGHEWEHTDALLEMVLGRLCDVLVIEDFQLRAGLNEGAKSRRVTLSPVRVTEALCYSLYREVARDRRAAVGRARSIEALGEHGPLPSGWATQAGGKGSRVVVQSAADAKGFATDERLRSWGMYVTPEHARDAMRHAVLYATKNREV